MPSPEHNHPAEPELSAYLRSARFRDGDSAGRAYTALQRAIFDSESDLSCFRLQLNGTWHTSVLGEPPPDDLAQQIDAFLAEGEATTLPGDVTAALRARRALALRSGASWTERHYREPQA